MQLLIHADIGTDYPSSKVVSVGYVITDRDGRMVDNKAADMRLLPIMNGVPSPLQYTAGASLPPGDYTLKLAVVEGDRVGTVEHMIHAGAPGGRRAHAQRADGRRPARCRRAADADDRLQVSFGSVHGYLEAYGAGTDGVTIEYEVATDPDAPALLNADVPPHRVSESRVIFTKVMPTHAAAAGQVHPARDPVGRGQGASRR